MNTLTETGSDKEMINSLRAVSLITREESTVMKQLHNEAEDQARKDRFNKAETMRKERRESKMMSEKTATKSLDKNASATEKKTACC